MDACTDCNTQLPFATARGISKLPNIPVQSFCLHHPPVVAVEVNESVR